MSCEHRAWVALALLAMAFLAAVMALAMPARADGYKYLSMRCGPGGPAFEPIEIVGSWPFELVVVVEEGCTARDVEGAIRADAAYARETCTADGYTDLAWDLCVADKLEGVRYTRRRAAAPAVNAPPGPLPPNAFTFPAVPYYPNVPAYDVDPDDWFDGRLTIVTP